MYNVSIRVSPFPARKCICAKTRVNHSDSRFNIKVHKVKIKSINLFRSKHTFIYNSSRRKRGKIKIAVFALFTSPDSLFRAFQNNKEFSLKIIPNLNIISLSNKHLHNSRHSLSGAFPNTLSVSWNFSHTKKNLPFLANNFFQFFQRFGSGIKIRRQKKHTHSVLSFIG